MHAVKQAESHHTAIPEKLAANIQLSVEFESFHVLAVFPLIFFHISPLIPTDPSLHPVLFADDNGREGSWAASFIYAKDGAVKEVYNYFVLPFLKN
jgi:hypothetical protein